ncbi:MAG: histidine kinase [Prevotella sp.]|nr:histidine kinase [Prevotella sp.]
MNKRLIIFSVLLVLLLPVMFQGPHEEFTLTGYLIRCVMPLILVLVFWVNYLWLVPRCFADGVGRMRRFILANVVIVLLSCTALGMWHNVEVRYQRSETRVEMRKESRHRIHKRYRSPYRRQFYAFAALRDGINLLLAIIIAYTMRMNQHMVSLRRRQQEADMARREAELRGLRNQISPHFLLNTLNNIYALAAISPERAQSAVMQLSHMLRHMLYDNQSEMVTLRSEADFIRSYVDLMKLRLSSNVKVETVIDIDDHPDTLIAPLLFISLVENAFKHGVSPTQPCLINIRLSADAATVTCSITNSNHPKQSTDRSGHGIGLANVRQRLDMVYPGRYTWTKGVTPDGMYTSEIIIHSSR